MTIKRIILVIVLGVLMALILGGGIYFFIKKEIPTPKPITENQENKINTHRCLSENEQADFKIERLGKYPSPEYNKGFIEIVVKEITTDREIKKFKIDDINPDLYHSLEIHKCGIYVLKGSIFNEFKSWYEKYGIWYYIYDGEGKMLISNEDYQPYSLDFRIDPNENYIVLEKGYLGKDDYALVVKDIDTKQDIFVLLANEISKNNPNIIGSFNMREWTKDGEYFWGDIFEGADVLAFFRIEKGSWKLEIFEAPIGAMGGTALNSEFGYITYDDGPPWTGDIEFSQMYKEQWLKEGKKVNFYLYNLFTKEKILLATVEDPLWYFKPLWLSDTELQYELPNKEKNIYKIK
ncbi:MAG: hypothetical protein C0412_16780, partial [Flavobacterium sp.]|nr:hypothetical protein [Flavobacterium sp.]